MEWPEVLTWGKLQRVAEELREIANNQTREQMEEDRKFFSGRFYRPMTDEEYAQFRKDRKYDD